MITFAILLLIFIILLVFYVYVSISWQLSDEWNKVVNALTEIERMKSNINRCLDSISDAQMALKKLSANISHK